MFGFGKIKRENDQLKLQNSILKKMHSQDKKKFSKLEIETSKIASDGLRHGSPQAGKYLVNKRKNKEKKNLILD
ncbi:hypothetical protein D8811_08560 [Streptococcus gordonii]|uniref:Uncharacterized protein n=1 Tax=Streptococcus gordonii TaxID=1302 RepID=A0AB34S8Y9_STRGN|nr:hypothetical protein [Streptococcus gordonii]KJQ63198.1 hypothetical protein TZ88_01724 [Streptococcus gordonii]RSJ46037.1 hypothetical protein D8817_00665 [Streptococcus gordonii]RSJ55601.1 hypothetical protein D8811_08560 [Streptococcus gordonii]RSK07127.1 hypothetical protein D8806_10475 [Streptococcus gordonii]WAM20549.1 hypothetical protein OFA61_07725 [Streptococcus gordonii]